MIQNDVTGESVESVFSFHALFKGLCGFDVVIAWPCVSARMVMHGYYKAVLLFRSADNLFQSLVIRV